MKMKRCKQILLVIAGALLTATTSTAAISPTNDTFQTNTESFPGWSVVLSPTNTTVLWDAALYDYEVVLGVTNATGDGVLNDHGLRMDTENAETNDEAVGFTLSGTLDRGETITFSGNAYNDNSSVVSFYAQIWNLTDDALLAQSAKITVSGNATPEPQDFSVTYTATAADAGDTVQIRLIEDANSTARDIYIDNFEVTSTPGIVAINDTFETDTKTYPGWSVVLSPTNTGILWDAAEYDFHIDTGVTNATGDGLLNDHGVRMDTKNAIPQDEAIGYTLGGVMKADEIVTFSGNLYNDNTSYTKVYAQLWNETDNVLLAQTASSITIPDIDPVEGVDPQDFSVAYTATADDDGDTLQIRLLEDANSTARDIFLDNFEVTVTPKTLYAYEGFNGSGQIAGTTGSGFTLTNTNYRMVFKPGLDYTDDLGNSLQTTGKAVGMTNVTAGTQNLQLALDSITNGTVYASYLLKLEAGDSFGLMTGLQTAPVGDAATPTTSIAAGFRSTSSNFGAYSDPAGIDERTGPDSTPYAISNMLVVLKANIETGELTVWLNPTNLNDVAGSASYTMSGSGTQLGDISSVLFSLGGLEQASIDEIRIGNSLDIVVPLADPSLQILTWNFNGDSDGALWSDSGTYDYTANTAPYVGSNAVANTLAFNGRSTGTDYAIVDKGAGHEKALLVNTINTANSDFGVYLQKLDFRANNMNITNQTRVSWSFDILGTDEPDLVPTNWTVKVNTGNYSVNLNVSDGWYETNNSVVAQTFDFVDNDATWTTVTGSYVIAVNAAGSAGGIQISTDTGGYVSGTPPEGIVLDNIQITIESIAAPPGTPYDTWATGYGLTGSDTNLTADVENGGAGDGLNNLLEYAFGGDPTVDDAAAVSPSGFMADDGGTNWLYYVHNERTDDDSLTYTVGTKTNLVTDSTLNTGDVSFVGESGAVDNIKSVTNRTEAAETAKFIGLKVEKN